MSFFTYMIPIYTNQNTLFGYQSMHSWSLDCFLISFEFFVNNCKINIMDSGYNKYKYSILVIFSCVKRTNYIWYGSTMCVSVLHLQCNIICRDTQHFLSVLTSPIYKHRSSCSFCQPAKKAKRTYTLSNHRCCISVCHLFIFATGYKTTNKQCGSDFTICTLCCCFLLIRIV